MGSGIGCIDGASLVYREGESWLSLHQGSIAWKVFVVWLAANNDIMQYHQSVKYSNAETLKH